MLYIELGETEFANAQLPNSTKRMLVARIYFSRATLIGKILLSYTSEEEVEGRQEGQLEEDRSGCGGLRASGELLVAWCT